MKLDSGLIDRLNQKLEEAERFRYGEVTVRFIRHEHRYVKVKIEVHNKDTEVVFLEECDIRT